MNQIDQSGETYSDEAFGFTLPRRDVRGRAVRLDETLDTILSAHAYPTAIRHLLAEALILASLLGSLVKQEGAQMTLQAQTDGGVVGLLVCDYKGGALRGYADFDAERLRALGANPSLSALFGTGYLMVTFDQGGEDGRYQGIVPLEGDTLSEACEVYFRQSEQIPTMIRIAIQAHGHKVVGGGLLLQHAAQQEEGSERLHIRREDQSWEHVHVLAGSVRHEELLDPKLSMEAIIWRLFHEEEEVRVQGGQTLSRGCRCDAAHYQSILAKFPETERAEMRDNDGLIRVDCAFCAKQFPIEI